MNPFESCLSEESETDLEKIGIKDVLENSTVKFSIQRDDSAHVTISITRIFPRLFAELLLLSFALFLIIFSLMEQIWFIFVVGVFWLICCMLVMYPTFLIYSRVWHFKRDNVQISSQITEDVWNAEARSYGLFGVSSSTFSNCRQCALRRKTVPVDKNESFIVNYITFQYGKEGEVSLWPEADAPTREKRSIFEKLRGILGELKEEKKLFSLKEKETPIIEVEDISPGDFSRKIELTNKILVKEVRLDFMERNKPVQENTLKFREWREAREALMRDLLSLRLELDGENSSVTATHTRYDSDQEFLAVPPPPPVPPSESSEEIFIE